MGFLFLNAFVLDYSKNSKAQRLCRNYSRLVATTFSLNTLVCINEMGCCFIFGKKKMIFLKGGKVLRDSIKLNMFCTFSCYVVT